MTIHLRSIFPAVADFYDRVAESLGKDSLQTGFALYDCHASALGKAISADSSFESFLFAVTPEDIRDDLAGWLADDGHLDAEQGRRFAANLREIRRPSDVALRTACRRFGADPQDLVRELTGIIETTEGYRPAGMPMRM